MSENVSITAGSGTTISTDELSINAVTVQVQRVKQVLGKDGTYTADLAGRDTGSGDGALYVDVRQKVSRVQVSSAGLTTATTAYVTGDQLGTILDFTNSVRISGSSATLQSATLLDKAAVVGAVDLYLFDRSVTLAADNAAAAFSDADMMFCLGILRFPSTTTGTGNGFATIEASGLSVVSNATSIFGALVTRSGHTFFGAVGDLVTSLVWAQD